MATILHLAPYVLSADDPPPDWKLLNQFQRTMTRETFESRVNKVFSPSGAFQHFLSYTERNVTIFDDEQHQRRLFAFQFADGKTRAARRSFKSLDDLSELKNPADRPLRGIRIALDPGHIGGEFARMEERFFKMTNGVPEQEAVQNLIVARLLAPQLERAGATVLWTKNHFKPVTTAKPEDFRAVATKIVRGQAPAPDTLSLADLTREAATLDALRRRMEVEFYRNAEIRARAALVNNKLRPDLTLCIHFNAIGEPDKPAPDNRLLLMIHGCYSASDVATPQQKFELLWKILEDSHPTELAAADSISHAMADAMKLPPEPKKPLGTYVAVNDNPYLYARNLIANRLYHGPVVYLEPFYQNNLTTYARLLAGDYDGEREFDGHRYRSIFQEYADAVARGVIEFYQQHAVAR